MKERRNLLAVILTIIVLLANSSNAYAASKTSTAVPLAPKLSCTPTAPTNGNVTVSVYYPSNASTKQYMLGTGGTWATYTAPITITSNTTVYARYQDKWGKWSATGMLNITNIDKVPPSAPQLTADPVSATAGNVTVAIAYSADTVVKQYKIGASGIWTNYTAPLTTSSNTTIYAKAQDNAGNWSVESSLTVSNIQPILLSPPTFTASTSQLTNQDVTISIHYSEGSVLRQYKVGDSGLWTDYTAPVTMGANGTVYAKSSDSNGNWTPEASYSVSNIDKTAPNSPTFTPSTTEQTSQPVTITISYSPDSMVKQYRSGSSSTWSNYSGPLTISSNTTIYAKAADTAGNWSPEASYAVSNIVSALPSSSKMVLGYTVKNSSTDMSSYNSMVANASVLNEIATANFGIDGYGNFSGTAPADQISFANSNGIRPNLVVSNNFDANIARQLLESPANRQNLKNNILNLLKTHNYKGVDIDIENVPAADRNYLTTLMSELYSTLKPLGYGVSIAVPGKTNDLSSATWNYAFDYKSLAMYSDYLMLMAYDEHYPGGTPGAIASIGWVTNVVDYALTVVPKDKIVLGMAAYGYDWSGTTTRAYSINSCLNLASQYGAVINFDSTTKSKNFSYTVNGVSHTVWFEDGDTIAYKLDLVNSRDLKGMGIWRLGLENTNYWNTIKAKLNK